MAKKKSSPTGGTPDQQGRAEPSPLLDALLEMQESLPRTPRQERSRFSRDTLLATAARLFKERGYVAITADDIAAAAGVAVGTFYNYFKNKKQILLALVIERVDGIFTNLRLAQMDFSEGNEREAIRKAIEAVLSSDEERGLRRVWVELVSVEPDLVPYHKAIRAYVISRLDARLQSVVLNQHARNALDFAALSVAIFTMLEGLTIQREPLMDEERLIESVTDIIYHTLFI